MKLNIQAETVAPIWQPFVSAQALQALHAGKLLLLYGKGVPMQAHKLLESLLSAHLRRAICYAELSKNFRGKPNLPDAVYFNLSHTEKSYLIGLCSTRDLGVDLEYQIPGKDIHALIEYAFSPDEQRFLRNEGDEKTFLKMWTLKEAYLKATGIGLIDVLNTLHVVSGPNFCTTDPNYSSQVFTCPGAETGSLVYFGDVQEIHRMHLTD